MTNAQTRDQKSKILKALDDYDTAPWPHNAQAAVSASTMRAIEAIIESGQARDQSALVRRAIKLYLATYLRERLLDLQ